MPVTRPALRYYGGKWRLAPWVISHFPAHRRYVEPFGGAASVLLRKPRARFEVWNDLDQGLVNLFRVLRDESLAALLVGQLEMTPYAREEFEAARTPHDDMVERARRLLVRSFMGHGAYGVINGKASGFRAGKRGAGCQPTAMDWQRLPQAIPALIQRMRGVVIESDDARDVIRRFDTPDTLIYCDPPYPMATRCTNNPAVYQHELDEDGHCALARTLHECSAMVAVSGYPCALYDDLYRGWARVTKDARADRGARRVEVLWLNQAAVHGRHGLLRLAEGGAA